MIGFFTLSTLALSTISGVSSLIVPRATKPASYAEGYLEKYDTYHTRYVALDCQSKHNLPFFDLCCHPLLATETLEKARPAECNPKHASDNKNDDNNDNDDEDDCDDEDDEDDSTPPPPKTTTPKPPAPAPKAPAPAPKPAPAPAPKPAPAPAPKPANNNVVTGGFATFYYQNGNAGACGEKHSDNELIAAIDSRRYGNTSQKSSLCGKQVQITNPANGKSVVVTIKDACPTCTNSNSIDLSKAAFLKIATEAQGMVGIKWQFL